ncbi:GNAT family N-acetyltransferase [Candidatus Ventrimonas sp. KK005]|nr:N-acetyltransferase family protein [Clostridiaceae bacterium]
MKDIIHVRKAEKEDLQELLAIYNYEVDHGVATLDLNRKTMEEWQQWFQAHSGEHHPLFVAELKGKVAGYASLSSYREKEAYRSTVELSVYVDAASRGQGIATALMDQILLFARKDPAIHLVVSVITSGNESSVHLHEKYGFRFCGVIHEVGWKMGRYLDIENYELVV